MRNDARRAISLARRGCMLMGALNLCHLGWYDYTLWRSPYDDLFLPAAGLSSPICALRVARRRLRTPSEATPRVPIVCPGDCRPRSRSIIIIYASIGIRVRGDFRSPRDRPFRRTTRAPDRSRTKRNVGAVPSKSSPFPSKRRAPKLVAKIVRSRDAPREERRFLRD